VALTGVLLLSSLREEGSLADGTRRERHGERASRRIAEGAEPEEGSFFYVYTIMARRKATYKKRKAPRRLGVEHASRRSGDEKRLSLGIAIHILSPSGMASPENMCFNQFP